MSYRSHPIYQNTVVQILHTGQRGFLSNLFLAIAFPGASLINIKM